MCLDIRTGWGQSPIFAISGLICPSAFARSRPFQTFRPHRIDPAHGGPPRLRISDCRLRIEERASSLPAFLLSSSILCVPLRSLRLEKSTVIFSHVRQGCVSGDYYAKHLRSRQGPLDFRFAICDLRLGRRRRRRDAVIADFGLWTADCGLKNEPPTVLPPYLRPSTAKHPGFLPSIRSRGDLAQE
jgi:hypothetical protein